MVQKVGLILVEFNKRVRCKLVQKIGKIDNDREFAHVCAVNMLMILTPGNLKAESECMVTQGRSFLLSLPCPLKRDPVVVSPEVNLVQTSIIVTQKRIMQSM